MLFRAVLCTLCFDVLCCATVTKHMPVCFPEYVRPIVGTSSQMEVLQCIACTMSQEIALQAELSHLSQPADLVAAVCLAKALQAETVAVVSGRASPYLNTLLTF